MKYTKDSYLDFYKAAEEFTKQSPSIWASFTPAIKAVLSKPFLEMVKHVECIDIDVEIDVLESSNVADICIVHDRVTYNFSIAQDWNFCDGIMVFCDGNIFMVKQNLLALLVSTK